MILQRVIYIIKYLILYNEIDFNELERYLE